MDETRHDLFISRVAETRKMSHGWIKQDTVHLSREWLKQERCLMAGWNKTWFNNYVSREWLKQERCLYFAFSQVWLNGACFRLGHFVSVGRWRCGQGVSRGLCNDPATGNTYWLFAAFCMYSAAHSSGAVWESRWPSWAVRPNEPSGFRGRKAILNHVHALVSACP